MVWDSRIKSPKLRGFQSFNAIKYNFQNSGNYGENKINFFKFPFLHISLILIIKKTTPKGYLFAI